ncbi:MAG TPA: hypothetical protein VMT22_17725, partial [Terriglobales bacterium]|nr:hypothetical protein [Terriglobales bacterium]
MMLFKRKDDWLHLIGVLLFLVVSTVSGNAAEERTAGPTKTPATATQMTTPAAPPAIPLEEVANQAMQVQTLIRGFAKNLADNSEVETIAKFLSELQVNLALEL